MILALDQVTAMVGAQTHLYPTSLRLAPGAINVLLGPTQAGKTTLMRIMAGLDRPTTGRVLVDGKDVTGVGVRDRNLAMVYQQFINYPAMTVFDNIASPLRLQGTNKGEIDTRVRAVAAKLHIEHLLQRLPAAAWGHRSGAGRDRSSAFSPWVWRFCSGNGSTVWKAGHCVASKGAIARSRSLSLPCSDLRTSCAICSSGRR